jgi:geranylgeranyl pyrophosphate synthase
MDIVLEQIRDAMRNLNVGKQFASLHDYVMSKQGKGLRSQFGLCMILDIFNMHGREMTLSDYNAMLPVLVCIELVQTASLIIDDLPAFDNAKMRRGLPCPHIVFGTCKCVEYACELLVQAYSSIKSCSETSRLGRYFVLCLIVSQVIENKLSESTNPLTLSSVMFVQMLKTGSLFVAPVLMALSRARLYSYMSESMIINAYMVGCIYQMIDDVMDVLSTTEETGKDANVDAYLNRPSIVRAIGIGPSLQMIYNLLLELSERIGVHTDHVVLERFYVMLDRVVDIYYS